MPPERVRQVRVLFEAALETRPEERSAWLRQTCGGDNDLYDEVEALLEADRIADQGLTLTPRVIATLSNIPARLPSFEGRRVGHYDVIREIGRGGTGAVYLARRADNVFSKQVAFKILRPEHLNPELLRRFHQEREIVASLDHPNIARLLDGGMTDEGLPYSVMEYVDGRPLDVHCDERRLGIRARVELIRIVCTAVQYAHQHLIVHRDLKPSNILVTADGCVKLLDFGIAKLLGGDIEDTFSRGTLATVPYASPEQIKGERITTSCDVYSLGVIAYELLTGRRPYTTHGMPLHRLAQTICEHTPVRPSEIVLQPTDESTVSDRSAELGPEQLSDLRGDTPPKLARRLSGELDNIVMTALRKEPERRYGSVEHLGEDCRRCLSGLPVLAQPDTVFYRARKFVHRHLVGVAAASMILLTMLAAVTVTIWQAGIARAERARAEHQASEAEGFRARAEREAQFAREQLRIVEQRTLEAEAGRREAALERGRAERRARDVQRIAASLLAVNANLPEIPGGREEVKRAATEVEKILLTLGLEGFSAPSLAKGAASLRQRYEDLEARVRRTSPAGWTFNERSPDYEGGIDEQQSGRGSVAYIKSKVPNARESSAMFQFIDAEPYRRQRVRVAAVLKSSGVQEAAGIFADVQKEGGEWLLDDGNGPFTTLRQLTLSGTNDWRRQEFVFDVPSDGESIVLGFALKGNGVVWADDFSFEVVTNVPKTRVDKPNNLDFEELN
jgi:serine/threonine protein kinase